MAEPTTKSARWQTPALMGYVLIILTFGVMGGWASVAPLDRAVVASGTVTVENNRKVVQHFEGGIVQDIYVQEGQKVRENQVLFRLSSTQARANADLVRNQLDAALALRDRLAAEIAQRDEMTLSDELAARRAQPTVVSLIDDQIKQFRVRRASLEGQIGLYEAKITQLDTEKQGLAVEKASVEQQIVFIDQELVGLRQLRSKDLISISRVLAMERERTRLEGIIGRAIADTAKADNSITESRLQISQLRQRFQEEVSSQLVETRQKISDLRERAAVADDVLLRQEILAPRSGTVIGLKVFTLGQVIRSGEPLMEIVPVDEKLVIHVQLPTTEIEHISAGLQAEIRFPAFHSNKLPVLLGTLESISRDRLIDEATRQPYFLGIVALSSVSLPEDYRKKVIAGMPAEVVIATGERTALNYMISPLTDSLRKALRE
jgi:HlyD family secretion protein